MDVQSKRAVGGHQRRDLDARQDGLARVSAAVMDADGTEPDGGVEPAVGRYAPAVTRQTVSVAAKSTNGSATDAPAAIANPSVSIIMIFMS